MKAPEHFQVRESYCCYRLSGHGSLAEAASKVIEVITFSREVGMRSLLIDTTNWTGHGSPSTLEPFTLAIAAIGLQTYAQSVTRARKFRDPDLLRPFARFAPESGMEP